ncbi:apoptosis-inducing factor 1, mitochondrial isoform X1 [Frankliniella occidentalis]|uniref:Apoptosis-inducing factor 1, mitochondrial isoform X1 n=1 Tax=Frankliniella occidentalis TaxID=133901 RepID=A0A6J1SVQ7_FRAOC|nr:apoptosis-inducing factor 1, mitochondrial isoform X1 [Frankliniella occidentalis]
MLRHRSLISLLNNVHRQTCHLRPPSHNLVRTDFLCKFNRCYSKKSGGANDESSNKTPRITPSAATYKSPVDNRGSSSSTSYKECHPGTQKVNSEIQSCNRPNPVSACPPPDCAHEESAAAQARKNNKRLLAAILLTAGTCYTIWKLQPESNKEKIDVKTSRKSAAKSVPVKIPSTSSEIPAHVPYLLVGGGTAGFSAFRAIKSLDAKAKVLILSEEGYLPYMRPPLSKEVWYDPDSEKKDELTFKQWNGSEKSLFYEPEDFYISPKELDENPNGGVAVARGWRVERIDPFKRIAYLEDGHEIKYEKCLLATGAKPKSLNIFSKAPEAIQKHITTFRGIPDYVELNEIVKETDSIAIIGGGFLGSELACALSRRASLENPKLKVYQIFKEPGNMHKVLPEYLSLWTTNKVAKEGVHIIAGSEVQDVKLEGNEVSLMLNDGKKVSVNKVIVAVGVEPNTYLAEKSGLEVDPDCGGFLVNAELEARSHLYAAGDCSCFYDIKFGRRRVEHHDHAVISGRLAGENMVGAGKPYLHQSMFWSDLGPDIGFEAIGIVDSSLPTVAVFAKASEKDSPKAIVAESNDNIRSNLEAQNVSTTSSSPSPVNTQKTSAENTGTDDYGKGIIFYLRDELVVGIVLWNVFRRMTVARQVLKDDRKYDDLNEVAKLFHIFDE